jgi:hypothetical protein
VCWHVPLEVSEAVPFAEERLAVSRHPRRPHELVVGGVGPDDLVHAGGVLGKTGSGREKEGSGSQVHDLAFLFHEVATRADFAAASSSN